MLLCSYFAFHTSSGGNSTNSTNYTAQITDFPHTEYRVSGSGRAAGLDVFVRVGSEHYISFAQSYFAVDIMVHRTDDFAQVRHLVAYGQPGQDIVLAIVPTVVAAEANVRALPAAVRNCYFADEKKLYTSKTYSYNMCMAECTISTIYAICGCLPFFYPVVREYFVAVRCG